MAQMTILTGPERRRRWSEEQRERILAEAFHSGARVCDISPLKYPEPIQHAERKFRSPVFLLKQENRR